MYIGNINKIRSFCKVYLFLFVLGWKFFFYNLIKYLIIINFVFGVLCGYGDSEYIVEMFCVERYS